MPSPTFHSVIRYLGGRFVPVARYHLAALFILSGASKAIDPFGLSVKLGEYFGALGLDFLKPLSDLGSVLLPSVEMLVGLMLLTGVSRRLSAWIAFVSMSFFTLLTLWLAIAKPVSDCGCFGDLIHLTNWATFFKNLAFYPFAIALFLGRNKQQTLNPPPLRTAVTYAVIVPLSFGLSLYSRAFLPPIDPTPFKIGVNIPEAMREQNENLRTTLIYRDKQNGQLRQFALEDTTWYDTTRWAYVDTRIEGASKKAALPSIPMFDGQGDRSREVLSAPGYTLLVVVNGNALNAEEIGKINRFGAFIRQQGGQVVALSASALPPLEEGIEPLSGDPSALRTLIQHAVGGALLLRDGTILGKWPIPHLPAWEKGDPEALTIAQYRQQQERLLVTLFGFAIALIVLASVLRLPAKKP